MKRYFFFIFLLTVGANLPAQIKVLEYNINDDKRTQKSVHQLYQGDNKILTSIVYKNGIDKILMEKDSLIKVIQQKKVSATENTAEWDYSLEDDHKNFSLKYYGGFIQDSLSVECEYYDLKKTMYFIETDLQKGISRSTDTVAFQKGENILLSFSQHDAFYIITIINNSDILGIYIKKAGVQIKKVEKIIQLSPLDADGKQIKGAKTLADFFLPTQARSIIYSMALVQAHQ